MYVCLFVCLPTCLPTYLPTYLPNYLPSQIHTYIHTYIQTYIQTYQHTDIQTYMHTQSFCITRVNEEFSGTVLFPGSRLAGASTASGSSELQQDGIRVKVETYWELL